MELPFSFGRYTLLQKIASGGTSEIYSARMRGSLGFAKTVAVKRLLPGWGDSAEFCAMLVDEARALTHLQHQSIVQVLELGELEGAPFIAMEYVKGIDCEGLLSRLSIQGLELPTKLALYIMIQVLSALEFAHGSTDEEGRALGIVHRDISPSNVLLSFSGEVKVADFGIATGIHRSKKTLAGQLKGKCAYMSPEQVLGRDVDGRADIFSSGALLFELLTARRLFEAATDFEVMGKVSRADLPRGAVKALAPELQAILYQALAKEPSRRYQSAGEMLKDIQAHVLRSGEIGNSLELSSYLKETTKNFAEQDFFLPSKTKVVGAWPRVQKISQRAGVPIFLALFTIFSSADIPSQNFPPQFERKVFSEVPELVRKLPSPPNMNREVAAVDIGPYGARGRKKDELATISIMARPWGIVDIPGLVSQRETPVSGLRAEAGEYIVQVRQPSSKKLARTQLRIESGEKKQCLATFDEEARIVCK